MNTAGRLLSIYDRLVGTGRGNDVSMTKVWAEVFELPPDAPHLEDDGKRTVIPPLRAAA